MEKTAKNHPNATHLVAYKTAKDAVKALQKNYFESTKTISDTLRRHLSGEKFDAKEILENATYPYLGLTVGTSNLNSDAKLSFGAVAEAGDYGTTITRPDLFEDYYLEQIDLLIKHHKCSVFVGKSDTKIPLPFALDYSEQFSISPAQNQILPSIFAMPELDFIDDCIANGNYIPYNNVMPLSFFTGERVDYSLNRLHHYTGTSPEHFQRFILLTNYQRYIDNFIEYAKNEVENGSEFTAFVEPGNVVTYNKKFGKKEQDGQHPHHLPQMPAYHLKKDDHSGITFINIGVGPSNAKNITDHLAVLRPHCWIMLGHCAGLRRSQFLGDYVLAHGYLREDHVMDDDLPKWIPIPPIAEVQVALQDAVATVTGQKGLELRTRMRTGTVATTDNRNWELRIAEIIERFKQSRAIAVDMESATLAANGFRFRVPYGTLLCVSDKPIHGELKLRGMANNFYRERVQQHLEIGLETIRILRERGVNMLHSRKLRGFDDPPMR